MSLRNRSPFASSLPLSLLAFAAGAGLAAQACAYGSPSSGKNASRLGGGGGAACDVGTLALANVGGSACGSNTLGSSAFDSSCTGNSGQPEYWCADFAKWVWASSGADVSGLTAAAGSFYEYGQSNSTLSDTPAVGDAVVYNYKGGGVADHVAIVSQVNPDGTIETVSGDWDGESGSEAHFSSTSHVVLNSPAYAGTVGTSPGAMGMTISAFIGPKGLSACTTSGVSSGSGSGSGDGGVGSSGSGSGSGGTAGFGGSGGGGTGGKGGKGGGGKGGGGLGGGGKGGGGKGGGGTGGGGTGGGGTGGGGTGGGGTGGSSGSGGGYAFVEPKNSDRHHTVDLAPGDSEQVPFAWHDASGLAPPADLWIEAEGRPVLQVSSVGGRPFVRAGLDVAPLVADSHYRLSITREGDSLVVGLIGPSGRDVLRTRTASGTSLADVVLPGTFWRASVVAEGL